MNRSILIIAIAALTSCGESKRLTPQEFAALQFAQEAEWNVERSTQEYVAETPEMRALLPTAATYHPYLNFRIRDSWTVKEPLGNVLGWYRTQMRTRGFVPVLRQCTPNSIWGGRVLIVDYCSVTNYAELHLAEDTSAGLTVIELQYKVRRPDLDCAVLVPRQAREIWTADCPVDLQP